MVRVLYKSEQGVALNISDSYRERNRERETTTDQRSKKLIRERRKEINHDLNRICQKGINIITTRNIGEDFCMVEACGI